MSGETPITLGDDLTEAADQLENQNAHIAALQQEIEKLRAQNKQLREAAAHCPLLRQYLDTGMTPEAFQSFVGFFQDSIGNQKASEALDRFRQLVKADRDGRLIIVDNTPRQVSPCDTCESGWGTVTTTGYDSCFNHCEKLAEYRKQEG